MAVFKNNTKHPIPIIINGNRRVIKPNTTIHGPESLNNIPGLSLVSPTLKTVIPNKPNPKPKPPRKPNKLATAKLPKEKLNESGNTNLTKKINNEIRHLEKFVNKSNVPSVTIAILTKDSYNLISDCCESILSKVKYKNTTILIADTGTKDKNVKLYYDKLKKICKTKGFNYKYVQLNKYHFGKNYNEVIFNHVNTDYVLIQNNDTIALNDYVSKMMEYVVLNKVGSVGCRMVYGDRKRIQHDGQNIYNRNGDIINPGHVHLGVEKRHLMQKEHSITQVDGNTAAGVLIRTDLFKNVDGFDPAYGDIFQDVDLMMKILNTTGKYNYCNRKAEIIHFDNATRFFKGFNHERWTKMVQDTNYFKEKNKRTKWRRIREPTYDLSIITLVNDMNHYYKFMQTLKQQKGQHNIEIIAIPNFNNMFTSLSKALNCGLNVCNSENVILCHQDLLVPNDWLNRIRKNIQQLEVDKVDWGVIGPAGITMNHIPHYYLLDNSMKKMHEHDKFRNEVFCLDELCMIIKKSSGLKFDEQLDGFHFYGLDLCTSALKKGLRNFAIDAWCCHNSGDGKQNVNTSENIKRKKYRSMENNHSKWN